MTVTKILGILTLAGIVQTAVLAESLIPAVQSVETNARGIARDIALDISVRGATAKSAATWRRRWAVSLAPLAASQALDAASSYGMRELNPVLASSDGGFGVKATSIKFGAVAGLVGVEYLLVRKYPRSAKFFTIVNWTTAATTTGFAIHNYRLPGR